MALLTNMVRGCLIVTVPADLTEKAIQSLKKEVQANVRNANVTGMVMDYRAVRIMDYLEFGRLNEICEMVRLLGPEAVVAGLQPGVVASLIDMDVEAGSFKKFLNLEHALTYLDAGSKDSDRQNRKAG